MAQACCQFPDMLPAFGSGRRWAVPVFLQEQWRNQQQEQSKAATPAACAEGQLQWERGGPTQLQQ
jgi:hypothetical protein